MLKTLLKIIFFPIWFPIKALWTASKIIAFIFLLIVLAAVIYFIFFFPTPT